MAEPAANQQVRYIVAAEKVMHPSTSPSCPRFLPRFQCPIFSAHRDSFESLLMKHTSSSTAPTGASPRWSSSTSTTPSTPPRSSIGSCLFSAVGCCQSDFLRDVQHHGHSSSLFLPFQDVLLLMGAGKSTELK